MRKEETEGRKGKQPDGSSKTREVKLAVTFSADSLDKNGIPTRDKGSVTYNAAIESAATGDLDKNVSEFACRIERETKRRGFDKAERQVSMLLIFLIPVLEHLRTWIPKFSDYCTSTLIILNVKLNSFLSLFIYVHFLLLIESKKII